jgi:hypothetical protein
VAALSDIFGGSTDFGAGAIASNEIDIQLDALSTKRVRGSARA